MFIGVLKTYVTQPSNLKIWLNIHCLTLIMHLEGKVWDTAEMS